MRIGWIKKTLVILSLLLTVSYAGTAAAETAVSPAQETTAAAGSTAQQPSADTKTECADGCHQFTITITRPATEEEDGERLYVCDLCGYSYTESIPATGHLWSSWITDVEPTCASEGHRYRICTRHPDAPHMEEQTIPKLTEHSYVSTITREPSCGVAGVRTYTCSVCGDTYTEEIPALVHEYEVTETPASCTVPGLRTYTCRICGDTYTEEIPALGHDFGDWTVVREAAAGTDGLRVRVCRRDGCRVQEEEVIPALPAAEPSAPETGPAEQPAEAASGHTPEIVMAGVIAAVSAGFAAAIVPDIRVMHWYNKKIREHEAKGE